MNQENTPFTSSRIWIKLYLNKDSASTYIIGFKSLFCHKQVKTVKKFWFSIHPFPNKFHLEGLSRYSLNLLYVWTLEFLGASLCLFVWKEWLDPNNFKWTLLKIINLRNFSHASSKLFVWNIENKHWSVHFTNKCLKNYRLCFKIYRCKDSLRVPT